MALPQVTDFLTNFFKTKVILPKTVTSAVSHVKEDGTIERLDNIVNEIDSDLTLKTVSMSCNNGTIGGSCFRMGKLLIVSITITQIDLSKAITVTFNGVSAKTGAPLALNYGGWDYTTQKNIPCSMAGDKITFLNATFPYINFTDVIPLS